MKLAIVTQYYWPESFIINRLSEIVADDGHEVTVLTGKPNYPIGETFPGYEESNVEVSQRNGIKVVRVPLRPRKSGNGLDLALNYFSFIFNGSRYFPKLVKGEKFDFIFVFAPSPITSVIPAILLKLRNRTPLAVWVQDLWPESLSATGYIKNPILLSLIKMVVRGIYFFSDALLVQSEAFVRPVTSLSSAEKVIYYPNSVEPHPSDVKIELPPSLRDVFQSNFCVVFAGNIGKAQSVETIVGAAKLLRSHNEIKLVLVGDGSMFEWVKREAVVNELDNIILTGRYDVEMMPSIYENADALLVTLKADEIFSYTIPSKIQSYMAAGKAIIGALNGEGARIIQEAEAGVTCSAENPKLLSAEILKLASLPSEKLSLMGMNAHKYFIENFEMNDQAKQLIKILSERAERNK